MNKCKVINLFGGPGVGKSTAMAGLFYIMKVHDHSVEMAQEYIKPYVYNGTAGELIKDQFNLLDKQNEILKSYYNSNILEYVITDCPLLIGIVYNKNKKIEEELKIKTQNLFMMYDNINILIERSSHYKCEGRLETFVEAKDADNKIKNLLDEMNQPYITINSLSDIDKALYGIICVKSFKSY